MENIRKYFETIIHLPDHEWQLFSDKLIFQEFPAGSIILKAGHTEKYLSFVEKDMMRFYVEKGELEMTFDFAFENSFISAYDSFLLQVPSGYYIETLAPTQLWRMSFKGLQEIYDRLP